MNNRGDERRPARFRPPALWALAAAAAAAAGLAAVYGMGGFQRNAVEAACRPALQTTRAMAPLARGEVAAVAVARAPRRVPDLSFVDASGNRKTLEDWRGRAVLLNLWATWCVPCRKEMPALDALQVRLGSPRFEVAEALEKAALAELQTRRPDRVLATNVEFWSAVTLDHASVPPELFTPMFTCARVAGWSAHILEQKREGRLIRPTAKYIGPGPRGWWEVPASPTSEASVSGDGGSSNR